MKGDWAKLVEQQIKMTIIATKVVEGIVERALL